MSVSVDVSYKSLNKYQEELCGDKVEIVRKQDSDIIILADGMGSGVKANILATLTSKIIGTMFKEDEPIEEAVETLASTLPICKVRGISYSTFSILQIFHSGEAYMVEFDNPDFVFIRNGALIDLPPDERVVAGRKIREYHFQVEVNDCFVLMSDGTIYAGVGEILNFGWTRESMAEYALKCTKETLSAARVAAMLSKACDDLYMQRPGDDTTVAVVRIIRQKILNIFTGPPENKDDDQRVIKEFMALPGKKVVCGGTTANIVSKYLGEPVITNDDGSKEVPPTGRIKGIDLVTEGVLTLSKTLSILKQYNSDDLQIEFFEALDEDNGAARLAKLIIEDCTEIQLYVGKANNEAHYDNNGLFNISVRKNVVEQLKNTAQKLGRKVTVTYI